MSKPTTNVNDKPWIIFLIATIFFWIGGLFCWIVIERGYILYNIMPLAISSILTVVGGILYVFWAHRIILIYLHNRLLFNPDSFETTATYSSSKISGYTSVNGNAAVFETMTYEYTDEKGVIRVVKSIMSLTPEQVDYLKQKETFKIRCKGKISAIIEDIPGRDIYYNER